MDEELERRIRDRAHQIWLDEGCPPHRAAAHWQQARELVEEDDREARENGGAASDSVAAQHDSGPTRQDESARHDSGPARQDESPKADRSPARSDSDESDGVELAKRRRRKIG